MTSTSQTLDDRTRQERDERLALLLGKCATGDETAFTEIYTTSSPQLYGLLLRILRVEAVAEEALQESFVKIWQKADTFDAGSGTAMTWLRSIARNQAFDLLRKRQSREDQEQADLTGIVDATPDRTKSLHAMNEDAEDVVHCLEQLPEQTSRCLTRAYCEGYSYAELAEEFDAPEGTVKSWVHRGLIALRKCLDAIT